MVASRERRSGAGPIRRILRTVFWALVFAFAVGFLVGTYLRRELDRPVRYIGEQSSRGSILSALPRNVHDPLSRVLMSGDHEEQI